MSNVNSLQDWKKKRSEMMGEYVAGRNKVNVMPRQTGANYQQPISQGQARVAEISRQNRQRQTGLPVAPQTPAEILGYQQAQKAKASTPQTGGTVLTQEQILANNINDIIKQMNNIMSQPGQMLSPSYSPYYNIFMEQYRENAEKAKASAYAQAVAGSGGYGSSYATLAGQQAYRDTMEGFVELTPSLVQTKGQAMSDLMEQYQMAKGIEDQLNAERGDVNDMTYEAYASIAGSGAFTGNNESLIRARLENMKTANPDLDVNKVMEMLKNEWNAANTVTIGENGEALTNEANVDAAYQYIASVMQESSGAKVENMENTLRASMKNGVNGVKYTDAEIDAAIESYKRVEGAALEDTRKVTNEAIRESLDNLEQVDLTAHGYTPEEIEKMDEEEYAEKAKEALLESAGKMVKTGQMKLTDFTRILSKDIGEEMDDIIDDKAKYPFRRIASVIIAMDDYETKGYITSDMKNTLIKEIWGKLEGKPLGATLKIFKDVDMLSLLNLLNKEQEEAIERLMKFM